MDNDSHLPCRNGNNNNRQYTEDRSLIHLTILLAVVSNPQMYLLTEGRASHAMNCVPIS